MEDKFSTENFQYKIWITRLAKIVVCVCIFSNSGNFLKISYDDIFYRSQRKRNLAQIFFYKGIPHIYKNKNNKHNSFMLTCNSNTKRVVVKHSEWVKKMNWLKKLTKLTRH